MSVKLKCQCCGIEQEFEDHEKAFYAGWDAPPHFRSHVCCNICPAVSALGLDTHHKAHADWEANGRPKEFNERCVTDKDWGKGRAKFDADVEAGKAFAERLMQTIEKGKTKH